MKKLLTLALFTALTGGTLSAQAQVKLDGLIDAPTEIGAKTDGKYVSLGAFTTSHVPVAGGPTGFGNAGLLQMYGAYTTTKLYIALAGTIESGGNNNFQLYMDLPNRNGVPVGTGLPAIAGPSTVFGTFAGGSIGGTKLDLEADIAIATTGNNDVQAAVYTATTTGTTTTYTGVAKSLGDGISTTITSNGKDKTIDGGATTGAYSLLAGTRVAYTGTTKGLSDNPGNANGGGDKSYALEYEFDRTALGLPSGKFIVKVFAAYVSGDAYWSSDIIPETKGGSKKVGNNTVTTGGLNNIGYSPDFTDATLFPELQAASVGEMVVASSARQADDAVVAMSVFPNPSQGESTVSYQVQGGPQDVAVHVTDLLGREVRTLLAAKQNAGFHNLKVASGDLAVGVYLVKVQVGDKVATRRLAVTN